MSYLRRPYQAPLESVRTSTAGFVIKNLPASGRDSLVLFNLSLEWLCQNLGDQFTGKEYLVYFIARKQKQKFAEGTYSINIAFLV